MSASDAKLRIRRAMASDAAPLCAILNAIIEIGGTTAFEIPLNVAKFGDYVLEGKGFLACFVAEDLATGAPLGFQALSRDPDLPENWADIATFAKRAPGTRGVGTALFAQTRLAARALELAAINAEIRADNHGGLAYYDKMGFETYRIAEAIPLRDGTPVDRIFKRYLLG
jgi:ribosomal protein S18 acetylase RimI-like enzyme